VSGATADDGHRGSPAEPDRAWCIAGQGAGLVVGPERALGDRADVRIRIGVRDPLAPDQLGEVIAQIPVMESGVREFTVTWHQAADDGIVAVNPAGGNQIGWSEPARDAFWLTPGRDALVSSVHQRFLLRHLTTVLLERDLGGRSIHAVTARWGPGVLAVAGPTCSGKTRLMNRLAGAGLVGRIVDDDCPIIAAAGGTATLVPRRYEVETARAVDLAAVLVLTDAVDAPRQIDPERAGVLLEAIPVPWPASWLPGDPRPSLPALPAGLPVLEVPARDDAAHADVVALVAAGLTPSS
jgi:hypothetical protein